MAFQDLYTQVINPEQCYNCNYPIVGSLTKCPECGFGVSRSKAVWSFWRRSQPYVLCNAIVVELSMFLFLLYLTEELSYVVNLLVLAFSIAILFLPIRRMLLLSGRVNHGNELIAKILFCVAVVGLLSVIGEIVLTLSCTCVGLVVAAATAVATYALSMAAFWNLFGTALHGAKRHIAAINASVLAILWVIGGLAMSAMILKYSPDADAAPVWSFWITTMIIVVLLIDSTGLVLASWWQVQRS